MSTATFDIETDKLYPETTKVWCAAVLNHDDRSKRLFTPDDIHELTDYLDSFDTLIGHNCIQFDFPVLRKVFGYEYHGRVIDTLIMSRTQRPNRPYPPTFKDRKVGPHSVEVWGCRLNRSKKVYDRWETYSERMLERNSEDVEIQYLIYQELLKEGEKEHWDMCHRLNMKLLYYLQLQENYGWYIDKEHMNKCIHFLNHWMNRIDKAISPKLPVVLEILETKKEGEYDYLKKPFKANGDYSNLAIKYAPDSEFLRSINGPFSRIRFRPVDLDKPFEVKDYLLSLGWKPKDWNLDKNGKRTSPKLSKDDDFKGIRGSLGRLIARRVQCKQRLGVIEGWESSLRPDGRISAKVGGFAVTGRLRHVGIVNVPNPETRSFFSGWMRKCFAATPDMIMIGVDSKGNQIRQLAARMKDDDFTRSILHGTKERGDDIHSLNQIRAKTSTRTTAKNFFYGLIFGASNKKLSKYGKSTREEFLRDLPQLGQLISKLEREWERNGGWIRGLDRRIIWVDSKHKVLNSLLQSDEAIQMGAAYCYIHDRMKKLGYKLHEDWGMLIWMHDEFQMECKPEIKDVLAEIAEESISWAGKFYHIDCPHEGESKFGMNWYETH